MFIGEDYVGEGLIGGDLDITAVASLVSPFSVELVNNGEQTVFLVANEFSVVIS